MKAVMNIIRFTSWLKRSTSFCNVALCSYKKCQVDEELYQTTVQTKDLVCVLLLLVSMPS